MNQSTIEKTNMAFVIMIVAVATIGGFMFGYDSGVINGTQEGLKIAFNLDELSLGVNVGAILIGCAIGSFAAGRLADVIGRKKVMIIAALLFIISAVLAGGANTSLVFMIARLIGGFGVGAASVLAPAYISEVTPASIRGRLSSVQQVMIICGLTGAFLANYWLAKTAGKSTNEFWFGFAAWRWMFWLQIIPSVIYFVSLLFVPESPRYLVSKGHSDDAKAVLAKLFGHEAASAKLVEIQNSLSHDKKPSFGDLFNQENGKIRPIVWVGIGLATFQQLVGINIVFYYGATLWQSVGFTEADSLMINIVMGAFSIGACILTMILVDKIGRKPLLIIGSVGMAVTLGIMASQFSGGSFENGVLNLSPMAGKIALVAALSYAALFNFSWGPIMWVMLGEMFPNQMRGSGLAVAGFFQWVSNFAIVASFLWLVKQFGLASTYGFYAISAFVSFFFVWKYVTETKGKELEHMEG